ncbi:MAG: hypothetical protein U0U69_00015 [Acidimicrobiia bacterium]
MARMIQVRDVRPELHAELMRRAKLRGMTLTAYLEEILEREVARPPADEVFDRIEARGRLGMLTADAIVRMIREMRGPLPPG